jgi:hypothetical protein
MTRVGSGDRRPVVVLADDDPAITENLAAVLERSGFRGYRPR